MTTRLFAECMEIIIERRIQMLRVCKSYPQHLASTLGPMLLHRARFVWGNSGVWPSIQSTSLPFLASLTIFGGIREDQSNIDHGNCHPKGFRPKRRKDLLVLVILPCPLPSVLFSIFSSSSHPSFLDGRCFSFASKRLFASCL